MRKIWAEIKVKPTVKCIKEFFWPELCKSRLAVPDIYLRIMCFLYPLYLSDNKILIFFTEKEFLYYVLTILTAIMYLSFSLRKEKLIKMRLNLTDCFLLLVSMLLLVKGILEIILQNGSFTSEIYFLCLIATYFLLKSFSGEFGYYLRLMVSASFILYIDILYFYLTQKQGIIGADILLKQPEAAYLLLLSLGIGFVLYEKESRAAWRKFYLLVSILGSAVLYFFGDIEAICLAGIFLLFLPIFFQPTVTVIKRNLILCFIFVGIMTNMPLLRYSSDISFHESYLDEYGIYFMLFLFLLGGWINRYWRRIPVDRNPEKVLMRRFQEWYKQALFIVISFLLLLFISGNKLSDLSEKTGMEFICQFSIGLSAAVNSKNNFFLSLMKNYGITGLFFGLCLLISFFQKIKKYKNEDEKFLCGILSVMFLCLTFFYYPGPFIGPAGIILISFSLPERNGRVKKKVFVNRGNEAGNEKGIIFNKCGSDEILS